MDLNSILSFLEAVNNIVWGVPLIALLICLGLYLTISLRGVQFRYLWLSHKMAFSPSENRAVGKGELTHFQALMTALAGTIGIGSITGVATAVVLGGFGSLFWMWIAALLGMAVKYAEAILAVRYRRVDSLGNISGGPMYYLKDGLGYTALAALFALFGACAAIGTGNMVQANSVAEVAKEVMGIPKFWTAIFIVLGTGFTLFGGIKRIGAVSSYLVPAMAIFYIAGGLYLLFVRSEFVGQAFYQIVYSAFTGKAALGGIAGLMISVQTGFSRALFSCEAGLGTSPIAAAAAPADHPAKQALISMSSVFLTTCVVCSITGLAIVTTALSVGFDPLLDGTSLVVHAFKSAMPYGHWVVALAIIPFAYSTILGWSYYGEKCTEYLVGGRGVLFYRWIYIAMAFVGAMVQLDFVWLFANIMNGLMAFPNLIALLLLAPVVVEETKKFEQLQRGHQAI